MPKGKKASDRGPKGEHAIGLSDPWWSRAFDRIPFFFCIRDRVIPHKLGHRLLVSILLDVETEDKVEQCDDAHIEDAINAAANTPPPRDDRRHIRDEDDDKQHRPHKHPEEELKDTDRPFSPSKHRSGKRKQGEDEDNNVDCRYHGGLQFSLQPLC